MHDTVIRNGRIVTPEGVVEGDLAIDGETVAGTGGAELKGRQEIDAGGMWIMPGGIDPHAHVEQISGMGQLNADTFETGHRSAAFGGTTTVISFAAQRRGERISETLAQYGVRARRGALVDHAFHISVCDPAAPDFAADLARAVADGHRSIKVFTTYDIRLDDAQILDVLAQARQAGALVCVHAETHALIERTRNRLVAAGLTHPRYHAVSHPRMAEIEAIDRILRFAEFLDQPVMIFHVSTAEGAAAIAAARARGVPVRAETCPHYLFMTAEVLDKPGIEGAKWMCSPPQREPADQDALWEALAAGTLDLVSSDHAPYRFDETGKLAAGPDAGFHKIANGLPGLETRLPLLFDAMMRPGGAGPGAFARLTATNPAQIYGLPRKGAIAPGMDADLVIWDPSRRHVYGGNDLHDNVGYNPWEGTAVTGWPVRVMLRGRSIVADGTLTAEPGSGRWIARPALATVPAGRPAPEAAF